MKAGRAIRQMGTKALQVILIAALVPATMLTTVAQGPKAKASGASAPKKSQTGVKPRGGPHEGIKVHGHWVIEIRNSDGALASRREFENGLTGSGVLVELLTRQISAGPWGIVLAGNSGTTLPCASGGVNLNCGLYEGTPQFPLSGIATATTALTVTPFLTLPFKFELQGTITATADSTITSVATFITRCAANVAPATPCPNSSAGGVVQFTKALGTAFTPVPVVAGQIIQVKVAISFS